MFQLKKNIEVSHINEMTFNFLKSIGACTVIELYHLHDLQLLGGLFAEVN